MKTEQLKERLGMYPKARGLYTKTAGQVIYVGKAKALRQRALLFQVRPLTSQGAAMMRVDDFDFIVTVVK